MPMRTARSRLSGGRHEDEARGEAGEDEQEASVHPLRNPAERTAVALSRPDPDSQ